MTANPAYAPLQTVLPSNISGDVEVFNFGKILWPRESVGLDKKEKRMTTAANNLEAERGPIKLEAGKQSNCHGVY